MTRSRTVLWIALLSISVALPMVVPTPTLADDDAAETTAPAKPRGRLPNHFGKLGVSPQQRQKIYEIQAEYDGRIDELLTQIERLRKRRNTEVEAILTPDQRKKLDDLREEQGAARKAKAEAGDK